MLSPGDPDPEEWEQLQSYQNIKHIQGTPLLRKDLAKANVRLATHCVVYANSECQYMGDRGSDATCFKILTI